MPSCVPVSNDVSDINANKKPPVQASSDTSRFSKIITCLFWRKKTDVVDMTKESSAAAKNKKMAVDRSERSRRVLKMESMRAAPTSRDDDDTSRPSSQGPSQMFLPSENPTASFLSYLNPTVRRACSDAIRTSSSQSNNKPQTREAFTDGKPKIHTRNTNYRGQRAAGNTLPRANGVKPGDGLGKPPRPPERHGSNVNDVRKPIIVPGITSSSDDDIGYNSDNDEITDLHDEIRRMNISQPDLRTSTAGNSGNDHGRRREGSISLSEDEAENDNEVVIERPRPQNPSPGNSRVDRLHVMPNEEAKSAAKRTKSMEDVIDDLFQQTQYNIDHIYRNGLESMDLETCRSDTMTPETCMRRLEEELLKPSDESKDAEPPVTNNSGQRVKHGTQSPMNTEMDNLLSEVSIWAQDRQKWLLEDGGKVQIPASDTRESTLASLTADDRAIEQVTKSNGSTKDRCSNWVTEQTKLSDNNTEKTDTVTVGALLTGPKLFRSTSKNPTNRSMSFGDKDTEQSKSDSPALLKSESTRVQVPTKRTYRGVQIIDYTNDTVETENDVEKIDLPDDKKGTCPEPWSSEMYTSGGSKVVEHDRSTLNDDLSELDEKVGFRARSPQSWLSSNGSCSNLMRERENNNSVNDCFEVPREINDTPDNVVISRHGSAVLNEQPRNVVKASNSGKSHQILRQQPKVHAPFRGLDRQMNPVPTTPAIPNRPLLKNTQLKPLSSMRSSSQSKGGIESFPTLPGMRGSLHSNSFNSSRNMNEFEHSAGSQAMRPFSEIPLSSETYSHDRNSNLLANNFVPQGPDSSHPFIQAMMRPVSETTTNKRAGKIGMGPIMATKDKQTYARDIINAIEKQRLQPQQDAFQLATPPETPDTSQHDKDPTDGQNQKESETGKKRHKVFNNSLIRGGYSYDKHSRKKHEQNQRTCQSFNGMHYSGETPQIAHSISFQNGQNPATTSVNDLSFSIRDSMLGTGQNTVITHHDPVPKQLGYKNGYVSGTTATHTGQMNNGSQEGPNVNRSSSLQTHSLSSNVLQYNQNGSDLSSGNQQTADKFRKLRSRRDQEMDWLMRDAAETEV